MTRQDILQFFLLHMLLLMLDRLEHIWSRETLIVLRGPQVDEHVSVLATSMQTLVLACMVLGA